MTLRLRHFRIPLLALFFASSARSAVVYSGEQNIAIPSDLSGVYLDFTDPSNPASFTTTTGSQPATWDFNLFFGGAAIANSTTSLPVTVAAAVLSNVVRLADGDTVDGSSLTPPGASGSLGHMGTASNQWNSGDTGYVGFILNPGAEHYYGWMSVTLRNDGSPGQINWWAWDTGGLGVTIVPEVSTGGVTALCLLSGLLLQRRRRKAILRAE